MFVNFFRNILLPQQMFLDHANAEKLLQKHFTQCFRNNVSWFEGSQAPPGGGGYFLVIG